MRSFVFKGKLLPLSTLRRPIMSCWLCVHTSKYRGLTAVGGPGIGCTIFDSAIQQASVFVSQQVYRLLMYIPTQQKAARIHRLP